MDKGRLPRSIWGNPALYWGTAAALLFVVVLAVLSGWLSDEQIAGLKLTLVELALDIAVVGIVGGVVKHAIDERRALASFRVEVLASLGAIHAKVYALRRGLALQRDNHEVVRQRVFELMAVRSELGNVGHHVRTKSDIGQRTVIDNVALMRAYLEELIDETIREAKHGEMTVGPELQRFIAGCDGTSTESAIYRRRFKSPYLRAKCAADPDWTTLTNEQRETLTLDPTSESPTPDGVTTQVS